MKRNIIKAILLITVLIVPSQTSGAQAQEIHRGKLLEKVMCRVDAQQSYALYLPSSYTHDKRWPIIYCFDPSARGQRPVERFKDAAEKYGYIVVGSNNSRNGSTGASQAAADASRRIHRRSSR